MASMINIGLDDQMDYKKIKPNDLKFAIEHIESLDDFFIIAKGNVIEGIEAKW